MSETNNGKPKVAFFDFACCEGCQLTVVDSLQTHLDLLDAVEIVQFREAISDQGEDYAVAFIEGSCTRESDEARLEKIREQATIVVALGACAHTGGVNALKGLGQPKRILYRVVREKLAVSKQSGNAFEPLGVFFYESGMVMEKPFKVLAGSLGVRGCRSRISHEGEHIHRLF